MEILLPAILLICILFLIIFFRARYKWNKSKKIRFSVNLNEYKEFNNLKIGSDSYSRWRKIWGFTISGTMFINDNNIILLPSKWTLMLFHTELPVWIDRNSKIIPYEIKFNTINEILIKVATHTLHLGKATVEYVIEVKNTDEKKEIIKSMRTWC